MTNHGTVPGTTFNWTPTWTVLEYAVEAERCAPYRSALKEPLVWAMMVNLMGWR